MSEDTKYRQKKNEEYLNLIEEYLKSKIKKPNKIGDNYLKYAHADCENSKRRSKRAFLDGYKIKLEERRRKKKE